MSSRRILLTCEDYFPLMGGAEVCVATLKAEYEKRGHRVTVYTNTTDALPDDGETVIRVPWRFTPSVFRRNVSTLWKLIGKCDVVHSQYSFRLGCICAVIARLRGKPMVLTQQGRGIVPEARPKLHHAILYKICQHVSMRGAHVVTATSNEIADLTAAFIPRSKIVLLSNGYDAALFSPDPSAPLPPEYAAVPAGAKRLLTVRRLVPKNGIHILVQALALVKKVRPDFHYFAIGDGRHRAIIEGLIERLGLKGHVTLLGRRENAQIKAYYQHADMVLVPSSAEATSIACIEAMGMGKPLVASRVGGLIDLLGAGNEYGLLVPLYGTEACNYDAPETLPQERLQILADAILGFLDDPAPYEERARKAQALARESYSWSSIADRYLGLYEGLLAGAKR